MKETRLKTLRVNGAGLHYVEAGEGVPVVLVHGSLSDYRSWGLQLKFLSKRFHAVAYSRRYHYPNVWAGDGPDYSAALHSRDLASLIRSLGLGPVHLIGSSYGAYTALLTAAEHPELVRTLVLGEPPIFPLLANDPEGTRLFSDFFNATLAPSKEAFQSGDLEGGVKIFFDGITGPGSFDRLSQSVQTSILKNAAPLKSESKAPDNLTSFSAREARKITMPCLLLDGEASPRIFHRITDLLQELLPHAERRTIPAAGHSMHSLNPVAYNETVLKFIFQRKNRPKAPLPE